MQFRSPAANFSSRQTLFVAALALIMFALAPLTTRAQTATVSGSLSNFDVINDTGHDAHGFEIEFEGLQVKDIYSTFDVQRYGPPHISPTATGVNVRWSSAYDANAAAFAQTTTQHKAGAPFAGTCYQWNGAAYTTSGCEHFGVALYTSPLKTTYRWLVEDAQALGTLSAVDPPVAIPAPVYFVQPPAQVAAAPVLEAEIEAPEPAEAPELYGDAQWVKVFKTELQREVNLSELVSDNVVVPQDAAHAEVAWEILQAEPASNTNGTRRRRQNQGGLNAATRAVVRRYEIYRFTGAYDPVTHQAVCADGLCNAPADGEVGDFVGAQMAAANVNVPSVTVAKMGSGSVSSTDRNISCGSKCVSYYDAGASVTLTASASSGSVFAGWGGACAGAQNPCTVTLNDAQTVVANFALSLKLSVSTSGKGSVTCGGGGVCAKEVTQGTTVTFSATPNAGFHFSTWTGACSGTAPTCDLTINKDTQVQAVFAKN
ncbi:MAG: InlB B-repeat-containing protein [Pyrinomonadaceae bacterium]